MGWRSTVRTINRINNQMERGSRKRQRELQAKEKLVNKMEKLERAAYEVQTYENYLDVISSIHKDCGNTWDWKKISVSEAPLQPINIHEFEKAARFEQENYQPTVSDKLLNKVKTKQANLAKAVEIAAQEDEKRYKSEQLDFVNKLDEWKTLTKLATRVLNNDPESYYAAIDLLNPFEEIDQISSNINFRAHRNLIEVLLNLRGDQIIPTESKSLLKTGKLSIKEIPKIKFLQMYQDFVCATVLRVARELFAILPIYLTVITVITPLLSTQTGLMEEEPILSVLIPRKVLLTFNFELIDPSDCMNNFLHQMNFNKTIGFSKVEKINTENFKIT